MPLLEVEHLHAHYDFAPVLRGISFNLDAGEIVSIFGRNGAGKTTTLRTIMGWLRPAEGRIAFDGEAIGGLVAGPHLPHAASRFIPEDRRIFATLSVEENLTLGLFSRRRIRRRAAPPARSRRSISFRGCASAAASSARRSPAASSRCWRSAAR